VGGDDEVPLRVPRAERPAEIRAVVEACRDHICDQERDTHERVDAEDPNARSDPSPGPCGAAGPGPIGSRSAQIASRAGFTRGRCRVRDDHVKARRTWVVRFSIAGHGPSLARPARRCPSRRPGGASRGASGWRSGLRTVRLQGPQRRLHRSRPACRRFYPLSCDLARVLVAPRSQQWAQGRCPGSRGGRDRRLRLGCLGESTHDDQHPCGHDDQHPCGHDDQRPCGHDDDAACIPAAD
jgi:hypothetical protein